MIFKEIFYENNQPANELLFVRQAGEVLRDSSYNISRSQSPTHVIGMLESGILHIETESGEYLLRPGQSIYLPCHLSYTISSDRKEPASFLWINIRGTLMNQMIKALSPLPFLIADTDISPFISSLWDLLKNTTDCMTEIAPLILKMLLCINANIITVENVPKEPSLYETYISNHLQTTFSVKQMAQDFHCSTDTINRTFYKEYGQTPYQYYQTMRINIAKSLLTETALTIEDIATRLHFSDRNYFTLYFKKSTGETPVQYRKGK